MLASLPADAPAEVLEADDDRFLVRAADHDTLSAVLATLVRPKGTRVRVEVDPLRA
jgi:hypothetical protein